MALNLKLPERSHSPKKKFDDQFSNVTPKDFDYQRSVIRKGQN
jgi:hypothetical protein